MQTEKKGVNKYKVSFVHKQKKLNTSLAVSMEICDLVCLDCNFTSKEPVS